MKLNCKACGLELPAHNYVYKGWGYCPKCTAEVNVPPVPQGLVICKNCGLDLSFNVEEYQSGEYQYCPNCGNKVEVNK